MKTEEGVYFRREDYASFWVRVLVDLIDLFVFAVLSVALSAAVLVTFPIDRTILDLVMLIWVAVAFAGEGKLVRKAPGFEHRS
jgi:uncharacterized RDD family membrane protein YckC